MPKWQRSPRWLQCQCEVYPRTPSIVTSPASVVVLGKFPPFSPMREAPSMFCERRGLTKFLFHIQEDVRLCLQKALRMTLGGCEQIHQSGLSAQPKVLSRGWPSLEFHQWDMEHKCECVFEDKGLICREYHEESVCAAVSDMWLPSAQRRRLCRHGIFIWFTFILKGLSPMTMPFVRHVVTLRTSLPLHPLYLAFYPLGVKAGECVTW